MVKQKENNRGTVIVNYGSNKQQSAKPTVAVKEDLPIAEDQQLHKDLNDFQMEIVKVIN